MLKNRDLAKVGRSCARNRGSSNFSDYPPAPRPSLAPSDQWSSVESRNHASLFELLYSSCTRGSIALSSNLISPTSYSQPFKHGFAARSSGARALARYWEPVSQNCDAPSRSLAAAAFGVGVSIASSTWLFENGQYSSSGADGRLFQWCCPKNLDATSHALLAAPYIVSTLVYLQGEKRAWDPVVTRISLSLRPLER
jgi:hypothetical protein